MSKKEFENVEITKESKSTVTTLLENLDVQLIEGIEIETDEIEEIDIEDAHTEALDTEGVELEDVDIKGHERVIQDLEDSRMNAQEVEDSKMNSQKVEEVQEGKISVNKERIKELALKYAMEGNGSQQVNATSNMTSINSADHTGENGRVESDAHQVKRNDNDGVEPCNLRVVKKQRYLRRNILIPLVAIISLIGVTLAAVQNNSTLNNLFGELFPYEEQVQVVGSNQTKSGIIYTVEGAFIDHRLGLFIVSMRKEDGTAFEQGTQIKQMQLYMDGPNSMGWYINSYLEDDNKKLVGVMNLSCEKSLYRKKLTLKAENIIKAVNEVMPMEMDLDKLYQEGKFSSLKGNEENWYNYKQSEGLKLSPIQGFKKFSLDDVRISEAGLSLLTSYPDIEGIENRRIELQLIDRRTGKQYIPETYSKWDQEEKLNKVDFVFENLKVADLPYLKAQIINDYDKQLIKEAWEVDFKLSKNSQVISKRILQGVKVKDKKSVLTKVEISALGVILKGYGNTDNIGVKVILKDGKELNLTSSGYSSGSTGMTCYYDLGAVEGNYIPSLIPLEEVTGIKIGEKTIKLHH